MNGSSFTALRNHAVRNRSHINEIDMGVASDVIGYPITRFAMRIGLPGRPVPHSRRSLQTAHAASQKTRPHTSHGGVE